MIRPVTDGCSTFGLELCVCSRGCGALLTRYDFVTDWLGRMVELCPKCGPQLLAVKHGAPIEGRPRKHPGPRLYGKCRTCRKPLVWGGTGGHPRRCKECQLTHRRSGQLERYYRLKKALAC